MKKKKIRTPTITPMRKFLMSLQSPVHPRLFMAPMEKDYQGF
jgi:hypothetical protein